MREIGWSERERGGREGGRERERARERLRGSIVYDELEVTQGELQPFKRGGAG